MLDALYGGVAPAAAQEKFEASPLTWEESHKKINWEEIPVNDTMIDDSQDSSEITFNRQILCLQSSVLDTKGK